MKKLLLTTLAIFCIGTTTTHAQPTEKQKIIDMVKSSDDNVKAYSSDGKRFYQKEYTLNDKGGIDVRVREKYLPAVTDGINRTPKTSYFAIAPKTLKYVGKASRLTNPIGIGLLMIDVLGSEDWNVNPNNTITYTKNPDKPYCTWYSCADTPQMACDEWFAYTISKSPRFADSYKVQDGGGGCLVYGGENRYNGNMGAAVTFKAPQRQVMTDEQFEAIVRDLAKAGNINAKQVILDAVKDEIADGKHDSEIIRLADDISQDTATEEPPPDNPTDPSQGTGTDTDPKTDTPTNPNTGTGTAIGTDDTPKDNDNPDKTSSDLPPFCEWAKPVCDFIDWVRQEPPQDEPPKTVPKAGVGDIPELSDVDRNKQYIDFTGECPTGQISFGINGTQYSYTMPYTHFCELLDKLSFWLLAFTYLSTAYFVVSNL